MEKASGEKRALGITPFFLLSDTGIRIYGGTAQLIKRHKKTELHIQHDIYPIHVI